MEDVLIDMEIFLPSFTMVPCASRPGCQAPPYFSRVFRSITDVSPVEYRRKHKG